MAKDKLITIRIEDEKRTAFKKWAESRNLDVSSFLYEVIQACIDSRIDQDIVKPRLIDRLEIDERIDALSKRLTEIDGRIDNLIEQKVERALESLRSEWQTLQQSSKKAPVL